MFRFRGRAAAVVGVLAVGWILWTPGRFLLAAVDVVFTAWLLLDDAAQLKAWNLTRHVKDRPEFFLPMATIVGLTLLLFVWTIWCLFLAPVLHAFGGDVTWWPWSTIGILWLCLVVAWGLLIFPAGRTR